MDEHLLKEVAAEERNTSSSLRTVDLASERNTSCNDTDDSHTKVYGRRWYIVAVAAALTAMQGVHFFIYGVLSS